MRRFDLVLLVSIAQLGCTEDDKTEDTATPLPQLLQKQVR